MSVQKPRGIVVCDIDGTTIDNAIYDRVRQAFDLPSYVPSAANPTQERQNRGFARWLTCPPQIIEPFVQQHVAVRPGFEEFRTFLKEENIALVFASGGWDLYIRPALQQRAALQFTQSIKEICRTLDRPHMRDVVPVACNSVKFNGQHYEYTSHPVGNADTAPDKAKIADALRAHFRVPVVCVGDDRSDHGIARAADFVWATGGLISHCRQEQIPHHHFSSFHDIRGNMGAVLYSLREREAGLPPHIVGRWPFDPQGKLWTPNPPAP